MLPVRYARTGGVATVTMDDGKANALSPAMLGAVNDALDRVEKDDVAAAVLAGRPGRFSAGFDLNVLRAGGSEAVAMVRGGFELAERLLGFPRPIVVACTGHAMAMGSFLLCAADHRVGAAGDFKIQANEVAIGITMPYSALALLRYRLTPAAFDRAVGLSALFTPAAAISAGWLDDVVDLDAVVPAAQSIASSLAGLDPAAHAASKRRARADVLAEVRRGIESSTSELAPT
ncbi:MAG TPA: crotonase/enoyl-CoA hydratase family protein [Acidimicrobiales bacterium]